MGEDNGMVGVGGDDGAMKPNAGVFAKAATTVDDFFAGKFYRIGFFVGSRPGTSIAGTLLFCLLCMGGFSQMKSESRADKLWVPQNTAAQIAADDYKKYWSPMMRNNFILLEAKSGNVLEKTVLQGAMALHDEIERVKAGDDTFRTLCVQRPANGHPCWISSILSVWQFSQAKLNADRSVLQTIRTSGKTRQDLDRMLGSPVYDANGNVQSAKALAMDYWLKSEGIEGSSSQRDPKGRAWEEQFLKTMKCDAPICDGIDCRCSYNSPLFNLYVWAERSLSDEFGQIIRGDVGLINAAFFVMAIYVTLNLGGLLHKIKSRALLALGCLLCIVLSGGAGYGLAMWMQFDYTPVMSVMPFVLLGIGVDDSFVIMNALDRTDPSLPVAERIATAISHAGVSIMFTSLTDFTAFAISVSSALPALSSFCMYAAMSILMLFVIQVMVFAAFATFDQRRVDAGLIDCCPCICKKGCPCCPTVPQEEAILEDGTDKNQLGCQRGTHKGGIVGRFLEFGLGPFITRLPVAIAIAVFAFGFCGLCVWQMTQLKVEDVTEKFIPDDSYIQMTIKKQGEYFAQGAKPISVAIVTQGGDYFASQAALTSVSSRMAALKHFEPTNGDAFSSWAESYQAAIKAGSTTVTNHRNGIASNKVQYYSGLKSWLSGGQGGRFKEDVKWVSESNAQAGIKAARINAVLKPLWVSIDGKIEIDEVKAVTVVDDVMSGVAAWTDMPGGKAFAFHRAFLQWEVFRIIRREMFLSVGLCLAAVFALTMIIIAHPGTAGLVFVVVVMVIIDLLGIMNMWGLAIDNVTVIQLVIAVGLAVDYSAHIGHNFMTKVGANAERTIATLGDVGSAVLNGGISTFLAVMLLAGSKSYVFRVLFQTFFLTVVLGLFHGMIVLPVLLCLVGPAGYAGRSSPSGAVEAGKVGKAEQD